MRGRRKAGKQRVVEVPYVAEADYLASRSENLRFLPGAAIGAGNSPAAPMNVGAATRISTKAATELGAVILHLQVIDNRPNRYISAPSRTLALRNAGTCKLRHKRGTSHIIKKTLLLIQQRSPEWDATYTISHRLL